MSLTRRALLGASAGLALSGHRPAAAAVPDTCGYLKGETMSFIVPFAAGGGYDTYARLLATRMETLVDAEIVVGNLSSTALGAKKIRDAAPDGLTLGLVNAAETILRRLLEGGEHPDFFADFTVLGQIAETPTAWVVAANSGIGSIEDLMRLAGQRPVVAGTRSVSNVDFAGMAVVSHLAGFPLESVSGYAGSSEVILSMIRGEVDLASFSYESLRPFLQAGDVRPILQLSMEPVPDAPELRDVPVTGGPDGWLTRRAAQRGADLAEARRLGDGLVAVSLQPRTILTSKGLDPDRADCLKRLFIAAATDSGLAEEAQKLKRSVTPVPGDELVARLQALEPILAGFVPIIREAQTRTRS